MSSEINLDIDDIVTVTDQVHVRTDGDGIIGTVKFVGHIRGKNGIFYGLTVPPGCGRNSGYVFGTRYFRCGKECGLFVKRTRIDRVTPDPQKNVIRKTIGDRVFIPRHGVGEIRYIGYPQFQRGIWYGVELQNANGRNNGQVDQIFYFPCEPNHGVFLSLDKMTRVCSIPIEETKEGLARVVKTSSSSNLTKVPQTKAILVTCFWLREYELHHFSNAHILSIIRKYTKFYPQAILFIQNDKIKSGRQYPRTVYDAYLCSVNLTDKSKPFFIYPEILSPTPITIGNNRPLSRPNHPSHLLCHESLRARLNIIDITTATDLFNLQIKGKEVSIKRCCFLDENTVVLHTLHSIKPPRKYALKQLNITTKEMIDLEIPFRGSDQIHGVSENCIVLVDSIRLQIVNAPFSVDNIAVVSIPDYFRSVSHYCQSVVWDRCIVLMGRTGERTEEKYVFVCYDLDKSCWLEGEVGMLDRHSSRRVVPPPRLVVVNDVLVFTQMPKRRGLKEFICYIWEDDVREWVRFEACASLDATAREWVVV